MTKLRSMFEVGSDLLVREWLRAGREDTLDEGRRKRILGRLTALPADSDVDECAKAAAAARPREFNTRLRRRDS